MTATARIASPVAPLQAEPRVSAPQTSQLVAGHVVQLIEQHGDWWKLSGADKYEGWMNRGYIEPATGDEQSWRVSLGCTVSTNGGTMQALPLTARISNSATIVSGDAIDAAVAAPRFPLTAECVAESAVKFFSGASYLWGGNTPWGCDCSGFVQTLFALHGLQLPRDAWQQQQAGKNLSIASIDRAHSDGAFAMGDLLYFSDRDDRRVTHVGLVLEGHRLMHSALGRGGVRIESLASDEPYVQQLRRNFVGAQRLF